jgi:acetyl esterase/lipase
VSQRLPVYIHLHGGGFLFGTLSSEDSICSRIVIALAEKDTAPLPVVVVNVNYRHTPEHRYPTAWNDVEDALHWLHDHLDEIGGDEAKVVMGGISAGAWLTASTTLAQHLGANKKLASKPKIKGQVLMIPALMHHECCEPQIMRLRDPQASSWVQNHDAPILPVERVKLFTKLLEVGGGKEMEGDLRLNPGNVTAEKVYGLPPTTIAVAGRDPLRDEGLLYARLLSENG